MQPTLPGNFNSPFPFPFKSISLEVAVLEDEPVGVDMKAFVEPRLFLLIRIKLEAASAPCGDSQPAPWNCC